jgi:mannose-6-phosphate isomerase-like protein (cupin superfamily)
MKNNDLLNSGLLEEYVLGLTSLDETMEIEAFAANDSAIRAAIDSISTSLETFAFTNAVAPDPLIKPFLMATINYTERMEAGEPASDPPMLSEKSRIADYATWLNREDMVYRGKDEIFARIIGYKPEALTAIVWLKDYAPTEVHDHEYEKFLVVEGTCNIMVEGQSNNLVPGDYFAIPLHKNHMVKVTSNIPCKVILQRVAA